MKKAIFITVRTGSTRLRNKALLDFNNTTTIEYLIDRLFNTKKSDCMILCTTTLSEDDKLFEIANRRGINCFRGSTKDKLDRWKNASKEFNIDFFVTADGDDLFCEPKLLDLAFDQFNRNQADFISGDNW